MKVENSEKLKSSDEDSEKIKGEDKKFEKEPKRIGQNLKLMYQQKQFHQQMPPLRKQRQLRINHEKYRLSKTQSHLTKPLKQLKQLNKLIHLQQIQQLQKLKQLQKVSLRVILRKLPLNQVPSHPILLQQHHQQQPQRKYQQQHYQSHYQLHY